jgi:ubiquinone/menaquinone biosynthesis C-methylase UbiE
MAKSREDYVAANRAAWDSSAGIHRESPGFEALRRGFAERGYSCLDRIITDELLELGVAGKNVAQLCCNNGRELLSVRNLGAALCVGFDQSRPFLEQARELAEAGRIDCRFVETDVYRIPAEFDGGFDIVLITIGVFGWMPDLDGFLAVTARLLRPGGALLVYEQHPVINMFEPWSPADPLKPVESYFRAEPFEEQGPILYDTTDRPGGETRYWFVHTLSDVITACLNQGLRIDRFREFPHNISSVEFDIYDDQPAQLPQSYILVARKAE